MTSFQQHAHAYEQYRNALIQQYRDEAGDILLNRIVMPLTDPEVKRLARELSLEIHCEYAEAIKLLRPVASEIYQAAKGVR